MTATGNSRRDGFAQVVRALTRWWAYLGGLVIFALVAVNVYSVAGSLFFGRPFPGVYEVVQVGAAVAMFMFLPYGQITGSNITADIFTSAMPRRAVVFLGGVGAACGLALAAFLLWRMSEGARDVYTYRETTAIYQFPIWYAYVPILASLALWALAAATNLLQASRGVLPEEVDGH